MRFDQSTFYGSNALFAVLGFFFVIVGSYVGFVNEEWVRVYGSGLKSAAIGLILLGITILGLVAAGAYAVKKKLMLLLKVYLAIVLIVLIGQVWAGASMISMVSGTLDADCGTPLAADEPISPACAELSKGTLWAGAYLGYQKLWMEAKIENAARTDADPAGGYEQLLATLHEDHACCGFNQPGGCVENRDRMPEWAGAIQRQHCAVSPAGGGDMGRNYCSWTVGSRRRAGEDTVSEPGQTAGTKLIGDCTSVAAMRFDLPFGCGAEDSNAAKLGGCANALLEYIAGKARPLAYAVIFVLFLELVIVVTGVNIIRSGFGVAHRQPEERALTGRDMTGVAPDGRRRDGTPLWSDL